MSSRFLLLNSLDVLIGWEFAIYHSYIYYEINVGTGILESFIKEVVYKVFRRSSIKD